MHLTRGLVREGVSLDMATDTSSTRYDSDVPEDTQQDVYNLLRIRNLFNGHQLLLRLFSSVTETDLSSPDPPHCTGRRADRCPPTLGFVEGPCPAANWGGQGLRPRDGVLVELGHRG